MATREFALDPSGTNRVQVQWTSGNEPAYVLFNGSILGQFAASEERMNGKAFNLPGGYPLHVRFTNEQPEAFLNGAPLGQASALADPKPRVERSGGLTAWLIINLVFIVISALLNALAFVNALVTNTNTGSFALLLFSILLGIVGIVGISMLLVWKKWGFYVMIGYVVLNLVLSIIFKSYTSAFGSVIDLVVIYVWMNRTNVWDNLS